MEEALEQITQTISRQSLLGVLKVPLASELTRKRRFAGYCPTKVDNNNYCPTKLILPDYDKMPDSI